MHLQPENLHYEPTRRFYWTRVHITFEDKSETVVLVGAGKNYLSDHFKIPSDKQLQEPHLKQWLDEAPADMITIPDASQKVYYKVYAQSQEGIIDGMKFLTEEVVP